VAKGSSSQPLRPTRQQQEQEQLRRERQSIRFFIAGLGMVPAQIALAEIGVHGPWILGSSILITVILFGVAFFFNSLANAFPKIPVYLRALSRPEAFFVLVLTIAVAAWLIDANARVTATTTATPGGSYQAQHSPNQNIPFIPTHARLEFPPGGHAARPAGKQENIWRWSAVASGTDILLRPGDTLKSTPV
jgi:hypothetical protein